MDKVVQTINHILMSRKVGIHLAVIPDSYTEINTYASNMQVNQVTERKTSTWRMEALKTNQTRWE